MLASVDVETSEYRGFEPVTFTFWRVACEAGRSALLVQLARAPNASPTTAAQFPFQYGLVATKGAVTGALRLAAEPNTRTSSLLPGAVITAPVTLVIENAPARTPGAAGETALPPGIRPASFDVNQPIEVVIPDPRSAGLNPAPPPLVVSIGRYDATAYPAAALPLPIAGYDVGNYYDPAHAGEGMLVDVGDQLSTGQRYVALAWFTYDQNGNPFWIYGSASFSPGERTVEVPMAYFSNGGFAGAFGASAAALPWGSVSVSFPDCARMQLSYVARSQLPAPVPFGSGERTWTRLTFPNGLACR